MCEAKVIPLRTWLRQLNRGNPQKYAQKYAPRLQVILDLMELGIEINHRSDVVIIILNNLNDFHIGYLCVSGIISTVL